MGNETNGVPTVKERLKKAMTSTRVNPRQVQGKNHTVRGKTPKSVYIGVTWRKEASRWKSAISRGRVHVHLITHPSEEVAALAYDIAAVIIKPDRPLDTLNFSHLGDEFSRFAAMWALDPKACETLRSRLADLELWKRVDDE